MNECFNQNKKQKQKTGSEIEQEKSNGSTNNEQTAGLCLSRCCPAMRRHSTHHAMSVPCLFFNLQLKP